MSCEEDAGKKVLKFVTRLQKNISSVFRFYLINKDQYFKFFLN